MVHINKAYKSFQLPHFGKGGQGGFYDLYVFISNKKGKQRDILQEQDLYNVSMKLKKNESINL